MHPVGGHNRMSRPKSIIPPLSWFGGASCKKLRKRYGIEARHLAQRAGVRVEIIQRFEKKSLKSSSVEGRGAIYDAMLDLCHEAAKYALDKIEEARNLHRGR
jgi:predicted transcriptional regulator